MSMLQAVQFYLGAAVTPSIKYECRYTGANCIAQGNFCADTYPHKTMCAGTSVIAPVHNACHAEHLCCDNIPPTSKCAGLQYNSEFWCCAHEQTLCDNECCDASSGEKCGRLLEANSEGKHELCCAQEDDVACCAHGIGKSCDQERTLEPCCLHRDMCIEATQYCGPSMRATVGTVIVMACAVVLAFTIGALAVYCRRNSRCSVLIRQRFLREEYIV
eukprot:GEMP01051359.1.p1 GENE.GEMP01051359.1~~GEMP01051359.1.p1  ORF type:complete len:217 (-),score=45.56 GEMP01051359.1:943-1593(-)